MNVSVNRFTQFTVSIPVLLLLLACFGCRGRATDSLSASPSDIVADSLASSWDEGMPLGNATLGVLVWQRDSMLRLSLDRDDLWDLQPNDSLVSPDFDYDWVMQHVRDNDFDPVIEKVELSYKRIPYPTKLPVTALEFPIARLGKPSSVRLCLNDAVCEVKWPCGARFITFVQANVPDVGWFRFENLPSDADITPIIVPPSYLPSDNDTVNTDIRKMFFAQSALGYPQGEIESTPGNLHYRQHGYNGFTYDLSVAWEQKGSTLEGAWSLTSTLGNSGCYAPFEISAAMNRGLDADFRLHREQWRKYWDKSSVQVPDSTLQQQYDRDMYKFGAVTRADSYPISVQGIWTSDNGLLPEYKGHYNYGMKVPLSYLPAFVGNHPDLTLSLLNTLWNQRDEFRRYASSYFGAKGLAVPGMATISGEPMGNSSQYGYSPTVGAWMAHYFWLYWKYTGNHGFLADRAYPFVMEAAEFMEDLSHLDENGRRTLEYSSTPNINQTRRDAWFPVLTNFDLSLMRTVFSNAAEMADSLSRYSEAARWRKNLDELPSLSTDDEDGSLRYAPGTGYAASNRYLSNALSIYPLNIIYSENSERQDSMLRGTLNRIDKYGSRWWTGVTFALHAAMQARAGRGDRAAESLHNLVHNFSLPNSFHVNGDMSGNGVSQLTMREVSIEGNFVFAAALQNMLLQSRPGGVNVFPAIPLDWKNVSFSNLRGVGGLLVSASMTDGRLSYLKVKLDENARPGRFTICSPDTTVVDLDPGQTVVIKE